MEEEIEMVVIISKDGKIRFIEKDETAEFRDSLGGNTRIARASHIEPAVEGDEVTWNADLGPVGGPILSGFKTRAEALKAEERWLLDHGIPEPRA